MRLPAPAPPAERTAGQLVGESMRLYGRRFWRSLAIGIGPVAVAVVVNALARPANLVFAATGGAIVLSLCYVAAALLAAKEEVDRRSIGIAAVVGTLVFVPVPFLTRLFIFPGLIWLALLGLAVPAALYERLGIGESLARAIQLGRADFVHALGSLAALVIVVAVSALALAALLVQFGDQTRWLASLIPLLFVSPLFFLGAAQLYFDQAARVAGPEPRKGLTAPRGRGQPRT
jgi:hypothetical protein